MIIAAVLWSPGFGVGVKSRSAYIGSCGYRVPLAAVDAVVDAMVALAAVQAHSRTGWD